MRLRAWLIVLCIFAIAALVTLVATDLRREWTQRVSEAERHLQGLARTVEEHAIRSIHGADLLLQNAVISTELRLARDPGDLGMSHRFIDNVELFPHVGALLLVDADGVIRSDSRAGKTDGLTIEEMDYFRHHRAGGNGALYLGLSNDLLADDLSVVLSRRLEYPGGEFAGIALILLDVSYLESFYEEIRVGEGGIITLLREDGLLLVQVPPGSFSPGDSVAGHPIYERIVSGGPSGVIHAQDPAVDFVDIVTWRNFESYPLRLSISAKRDELLAGWTERLFWSLVSLVGVVLGILVLAFYLWVHIGRLQQMQQALTLQKSYFQQLFDSSPEGIVILDNNDRIVDVNKGFQKLFQYEFEETHGRTLNELILPEGMEHEGTTLSQRVLQHEQVQSETVRRRKDGALVHVSILGAPIMMMDNQVGVYGIYRDITRRIEAEQEIRGSEERHRIVAEQTGQIIYDYDVNTGKITWSGAIRKITGYDYDEFQAVDVDRWVEMIHPDDRGYAMQLLEEARERCGHYSAEYRFLHRNGSWIYIEDNGAFMRDQTGEVSRMLGSMSDITERKRISSEMAYQAAHDALTGLANRHAFEERVSQLLYTRRGGQRHHALLFIDLDQFKVVNDTCGHQAGDHLLRQLTSVMAASTRETDTLARLGGDEFGVLLVDCPLDKAKDIAANIIATINDFRFTWEDKTFGLGASVGLVEITRETESVAALFSAADSACYAAKDKGRNRVVVYHEGDQEMVQRHGEMSWVSHITKALEEDRFLMYWQPIERVAAPDDGKVHGEFLLRMVDESGEIALPGSFIPAAERYNLMPALDRWVIRKALSLLAGRKNLLASINVSGISLGSENLVEYVVDEFKHSGTDPSLVCFEITETSAIANLQRARDFVEQMQSFGCSIALDDFGSGLSSFAYLKTLPVDYLKIDGAFVKDIIDDPADQAMVEAIVRIGQVLGIRTIAEYVANRKILKHLEKVGVDYVQGHEIRAPAPWRD